MLCLSFVQALGSHQASRGDDQSTKTSRGWWHATSCAKIRCIACHLPSWGDDDDDLLRPKLMAMLHIVVKLKVVWISYHIIHT
jgi:hypothetical protein